MLFSEYLNKLTFGNLTCFTGIKLSGLNNPSEAVLIKKIWNRIVLKAFPEKISIPVDDVGDLERELMILRQELQAHHLTILFYETDVFPHLVDICRQFTDILHIGWVTEQPVPCANVRTFHPDSSDICAAIQHWLDEISHEVE